jgi:hypothetical protein
MKRISVVIIGLAAFCAASQAAPLTPTITLIPSDGNVSAPPGMAAGWGFTLTNTDMSDWVVLTGSSFTGSTTYGSYVDYLSMPGAPLYVAGPPPESSTVMQNWDATSNPPLGVGEFDINATAPPGASIPGDIIVHYSVFSQDPNDPNFNPDTSTVVADAMVQLPVDITVSAAAPEPATFGLFLSAALPVIFWRSRSAKRRR